MANKLTYLELPVTDVATSKRFYGTLFGWTFEDFGPDYAAFGEAGLEGGLNASGDDGSKSRAPLAMVQTDQIEQMEADVRAAGGTITKPTFAYPGGRRFHFTDPSGNELAVMQPD